MRVVQYQAEDLFGYQNLAHQQSEKASHLIRNDSFVSKIIAWGQDNNDMIVGVGFMAKILYYCIFKIVRSLR